MDAKNDLYCVKNTVCVITVNNMHKYYKYFEDYKSILRGQIQRKQLCYLSDDSDCVNKLDRKRLAATQKARMSDKVIQ